MPTDNNRTRLRAIPSLLAAVTGLGLAVAGCSSSHSSPGTASAKTTAVSIDLTPGGCAPKPARIPAGEADFTVTNKGASAVSEAELRNSDLTKILGEQENLTPGLSGGFSLTIQPGTYKINCPGATQQRWTFTVTGKLAGTSWQSNPQLSAAVSGYTRYVDQNAADLVSHTQTFCHAIDAGNLSQAKILYPKARVYYEHIEPVAEIWGSLDTEIDGRWENPVTVASQFVGFHKIEQLLWENNTLTGTPKLCAGLVKNEQQLLTLVRAAQYNPLEMASGSTDLINEAATAKITGEEERYSNTDFPVFQANVDGAMEVVSLLQPYLQHKDSGLLTQIRQRDAAIGTLLAKYKASPGYDDTGYVEYSTVLNTQRRQLSTAVNAFAEALSKLSVQVSG
ncbi:MAG TPA: iron uptake system protein EfeO [Streptosporangiaceae bacterium]|jgi:iron uptake system component EfeO|nr:iron uptake system protein EfeO [Streptosporangiaceae bacterium]